MKRSVIFGLVTLSITMIVSLAVASRVAADDPVGVSSVEYISGPTMTDSANVLGLHDGNSGSVADGGGTNGIYFFAFPPGYYGQEGAYITWWMATGGMQWNTVYDVSPSVIGNGCTAYDGVHGCAPSGWVNPRSYGEGSLPATYPYEILGVDVYSSYGITVDAVELHGAAYNPSTATPASTITPTSYMLQPFQNTQACVQVQPTSTPTPRASPTRFSLTAQPTPTRTVTRTGTPPTPTPIFPIPISTSVGSSYDSGLEAFDNGLGTWTSEGDVTGWYTATGQNGNAGVAQISLPFDPWPGEDNPDAYTLHDSLGGMGLIFSYPEGFPSGAPLHLRGYSKFADPIAAAEPVHLQVYLLDQSFTSPGGSTTMAWTEVSGDFTYTLTTIVTPTVAWVSPPDGPTHRKFFLLSPIWSPFDFEFTMPAGHTITAIALVLIDYHDFTGGKHLWVDDLRITAGSDLKLPICSVITGPTPVPVKPCPITYTNIDVFSTCQTPTDPLNVGGWLDWAVCHIVKFFEFNKYNGQQISEMGTRQNNSEPIGSALEVSTVFSDFQAQLDYIQTLNRPISKSPLDFINLFNLSILDHPETLFVFPSIGELTSLPNYISDCPGELVDKGQAFSRGACLAIFELRNTIIIQLMQWLLDAACLVGLIRYIYVVFKNIANG